MLKNAADLERMRQEVQAALATRQGGGGARLVVAMGTCGIAAGAREVVAALLDELAKREIFDVQVTQTGCKGLCDREPTLDVIRPGEAPVTYGDVTPDLARRIVAEHVMGGQVVQDHVLFSGDAKGQQA